MLQHQQLQMQMQRHRHASPTAHRPPPPPLRTAAAPKAVPSLASASPADPQSKRRDALLRAVADLYGCLYDYDLPISGLVSPDVVLEDDALQVTLRGAEQVSEYMLWLHTGADAGEPSAAASIDQAWAGAPLEKAVLVGTEAVLADEMAAAAEKAGLSLHVAAGAREDAVIATWVGGRRRNGAAGGGSGSGSASGEEEGDEEVVGREEFFFDASEEGAAATGGDPRITHIYTTRTQA
jgi:hypothetical protein